MELIDVDKEDLGILNGYAEGVEERGEVVRYVYPAFGVNFGFGDKDEGMVLV
jgi:hypothetical protein